MDEYYRNLDRVFSEASPIYDQKVLSNFINVNIRRQEMKLLLRLSVNRNRILEIGCGTGEEASAFIRSTGKPLTCIDISSGMISAATSKMEKYGISNLFTSYNIAARNSAAIGSVFDLIYSFNGAMNTEPDIRGMIESIGRITRKGSIVMVTVRNKFCLGERIVYALAGRGKMLPDRRGDFVEVEVAGNRIRSRYYDSQEIRSFFEDSFTLRKIRGHAVVLPPYLADRIRGKILRRIVCRLDDILSVLPFFRRMGDEVTHVLEKQ